MNKSTKGAFAAGAAAVLLLGGAGTLAFWSDTSTTSGTSITSGHLKLTNEDCDGGWVLDGGDPYVAQPLVPGDTLTKTCEYTLDVAGEHLTNVDFTVTAPNDVTGALALIDDFGVTTAVTLNGTAQPTATNVTVEDGDTVEVTMTIDWLYGSENNDSNVSGGLTASLADLTVKVTQNHL